MAYFLQLEGIPGTSVRRDHEKWIEVDTVDWGVAQSTEVIRERGTTRRGAPTIRPVTIGAPVSNATPALFLACVQGRSISEAVFEAVTDTHQGSAVTLRIELTDVQLTRLDLAGADGDPQPETVFALDYREITLTTFEIAGDGTQGASETATWSVDGR